MLGFNTCSSSQICPGFSTSIPLLTRLCWHSGVIVRKAGPQVTQPRILKEAIRIPADASRFEKGRGPPEKEISASEACSDRCALHEPRSRIATDEGCALRSTRSVQQI